MSDKKIFSVIYGTHSRQRKKSIKANNANEAYNIIDSAIRNREDEYIQYIELDNQIVYDYLGNITDAKDY